MAGITAARTESSWYFFGGARKTHGRYHYLMMDKIEARAVYAEHENGAHAHVIIVTKVGDNEYHNMHVSGRKEDVKDYYEGKISMNELRARWVPNWARKNECVSK